MLSPCAQSSLPIRSAPLQPAARREKARQQQQQHPQVSSRRESGTCYKGRLKPIPRLLRRAHRQLLLMMLLLLMLLLLLLPLLLPLLLLRRRRSRDLRSGRLVRRRSVGSVEARGSLGSVGAAGSFDTLLDSGPLCRVSAASAPTTHKGASLARHAAAATGLAPRLALLVFSDANPAECWRAAADGRGTRAEGVGGRLMGGGRRCGVMVCTTSTGGSAAMKAGAGTRCR
jgi:hypothetical protein